MPVEGDAEDAGLGGAGEEVAVVRGQFRLPVGAGFIATVEGHTYTFHKRFLACSQTWEDHRQVGACRCHPESNPCCFDAELTGTDGPMVTWQAHAALFQLGQVDTAEAVLAAAGDLGL